MRQKEDRKPVCDEASGMFVWLACPPQQKQAYMRYPVPNPAERSLAARLGDAISFSFRVRKPSIVGPLPECRYYTNGNCSCLLF